MDRREFLRGSLVVLATPVLADLSAASNALAKHRANRPTVEVALPEHGTDVTALLMDAIAGAPDGARLIIPAGRYQMDGTCFVAGRKNLRIEGAGQAVFFATRQGPLDSQGNSQRRHFFFADCRGIALENIRVESTNTVESYPGFTTYDRHHEFEHGFCFEGCSRIRVTACQTHATWGDGIYVGGRLCSDVVIRGCTISSNGRHGIGLTFAEGVLVEDLNITNSRYSGIDMEPDLTSMYCRDLVIRNSSINSWLEAFPACGQGEVSNVLVHDNHITASSIPWLQSAPSAVGVRQANWTVLNNTVDAVAHSPRAAVEFRHTDGIRVMGNRSPVGDNQSLLAASFTDCSYSSEIPELVLAGNDFSPGGEYIVVAQSAAVETTGNLPTDLQVLVS